MRIRWIALLCVGTVSVALAGMAPTQSQARSKAPRLIALSCVPTKAPGCRGAVRVKIGKQVRFKGRRLKVGMRVTFRWPRGHLTTRLRRTRRVGLTARVPEGTRAGRVSVTVRSRAGRRSNRRRIVVRASRYSPSGVLPEVFRGNGMWIWYLSSSEGGDIGAIANRARAAGMSTVFIKSSDGGTRWSQFSPSLVLGLHARGLRVCAWQFVYGAQPEAEADAGAAAVATGADCLVIDAESAYEGRYLAAQQYMARLRGAVGPTYPVGLTSFAYVDSHPRLPYSVFLAPGGAQANLPQVYWKDIGGSVDAVSARSVAHNRIYGVPMAPLGQAYNAPKSADLQRFRSLWSGYGAGGMSWWSWQSASAGTWGTLSKPAPGAVASPDPGWPVLAQGSRGDQVIWLQQHLAAGNPAVKIDGRFSSATANALKTFQRAKGLQVTGETDSATWTAVLAQPLRLVRWAAR